MLQFLLLFMRALAQQSYSKQLQTFVFSLFLLPDRLVASVITDRAFAHLFCKASPSGPGER
jgi:hypothetical protein